MIEKYSLKRCPCCGSDFVYARETHRIHDCIPVGYVVCNNCGLHTDLGSLDSVVESWNRRRLYNDVPESYVELTDQYGRALKILMEVDLDYLSKLLEKVKKAHPALFVNNASCYAKAGTAAYFDAVAKEVSSDG
ncbi:MAG: hypothetical protein E7461_00570 [Ruminococcaceae bacterium]|nr:hypothetical protein [Oscillospiraceae bacterium]